VLMKLIQQSQIVELEAEKVVFERGRKTRHFVLVLEGKLEVRSGSEEFISYSGPFTYLGVGALKKKSFVPDFSAKVVKSVQLLRISKRFYDSALKATKLERMNKPPEPVTPSPKHPRTVKLDSDSEEKTGDEAPKKTSEDNDRSLSDHEEIKLESDSENEADLIQRLTDSVPTDLLMPDTSHTQQDATVVDLHPEHKPEKEEKDLQ